MFPAEVYIQRRKVLKQLVGDGIILFLGNRNVPMNYKGNDFPFRQDSSFLYYFGLDMPDLAGIVDAETGDDIIYGNDISLEDAIWMGRQASLSEKASAAGITKVKTLEKLDRDVFKAIARDREVHYLPPYREQRRLQLAYYDNLKYEEVDRNSSPRLIRAVASQRSVKDSFELEHIENTMNEVTYEAYKHALSGIKPGVREFEIAAIIKYEALKKNCRMAYPVICSVNGEVLHNHHYGNTLGKGQLLLIDAGAESEMHYATDITRTYPVDGKFSPLQMDIYNIVLEAQMKAIEAIRPGVPFRDIHFLAARVIAGGLKEMGLMKGNPDDAVQHGAHALFFPHGIGHMMGLDVHDMEDIGEDYVGYDEEFKRSDQFGTAYLRMAKRLQEGYVVTVEPGIYFIWPLIDKWHSEGRYRDFINYRKLFRFASFGGIRIEDNVVVTSDGHRILGKPIPKEAGELESIMESGQ